MDISPFSSLVHVLVGALAGGCGSVACLWHSPRYNFLLPPIIIKLVMTMRAALIMVMRAFLMMTSAAMLIDHMGNLDIDHGDSLGHDDAGQVISGEETALVLLNFIPKPAMVVYKAYTQSVDFCFFLGFILTFVCVFFLLCQFVCLGLFCSMKVPPLSLSSRPCFHCFPKWLIFYHQVRPSNGCSWLLLSICNIFQYFTTDSLCRLFQSFEIHLHSF